MPVTSSEIINSSVSVGTSATLLVSNLGRRTLLTFTNNGSVTVYLGNASVSSSAFVWPIPAGESIQFNTDGNDVSPQMKWYGVTPSSTASVSVGEVIN